MPEQFGFGRFVETVNATARWVAKSPKVNEEINHEFE